MPEQKEDRDYLAVRLTPESRAALDFLVESARTAGMLPIRTTESTIVRAVLEWAAAEIRRARNGLTK